MARWIHGCFSDEPQAYFHLNFTPGTGTFKLWDEMDKCLQRYKLPKLTQEETDILKSPISINEIKVVVINFPAREKKAMNSGLDKGLSSLDKEIRVATTIYRVAGSVLSIFLYISLHSTTALRGGGVFYFLQVRAGSWRDSQTRPRSHS